jgi:hypothetical protein
VGVFDILLVVGNMSINSDAYVINKSIARSAGSISNVLIGRGGPKRKIALCLAHQHHWYNGTCGNPQVHDLHIVEF